VILNLNHKKLLEETNIFSIL